MYESATDCICAALYVSEDTAKFSALAKTLYDNVMQLVPVYTAAVDTEDQDRSLFWCYNNLLIKIYRAHALSRIFTEMGESFLFSIVHYPDNELGNVNTFNLLIHCANHPDYEVIIEFWISFEAIIF